MTRFDVPVMIFGAGLGTRMAPLTETKPKPLIEVAGKALIDHALDHTTGHRVVVNTHYKAPQMAAHLAPLPQVSISDETDLLRDTGGGLKAARDLLGQDVVFTLNSDAIWAGPNPLEQLWRAWQPERMDALLLMIPAARMAGHGPRGDFRINPDGTLTRDPTGLVYTGAQILKTSQLEPIAQKVFSLNLLWNALEPEGRLHGTFYDGQLTDVGTPAGISFAEDMIAGARDV